MGGHFECLNRAEKADQLLALVCAEHQAANVVGDHEEPHRHQVGIGPSKAFALKCHALFEFRYRRQRTNVH